MNKGTLLSSIQGLSGDEVRHEAMAMSLVRRIVLDYLTPGGLTAEEAMELLVALVDPATAWLFLLMGSSPHCLAAATCLNHGTGKTFTVERAQRAAHADHYRLRGGAR